jgi:hypothetical protein
MKIFMYNYEDILRNALVGEENASWDILFLVAAANNLMVLELQYWRIPEY